MLIEQGLTSAPTQYGLYDRRTTLEVQLLNINFFF